MAAQRRQRDVIEGIAQRRQVFLDAGEKRRPALRFGLGFYDLG